MVLSMTKTRLLKYDFPVHGLGPKLESESEFQGPLGPGARKVENGVEKGLKNNRL